MSLSDKFCLGHTHLSLISQDKLLQREDFHVHRRNAEILSILYILGIFVINFTSSLYFEALLGKGGYKY